MPAESAACVLRLTISILFIVYIQSFDGVYVQGSVTPKPVRVSSLDHAMRKAWLPGLQSRWDLKAAPEQQSVQIQRAVRSLGLHPGLLVGLRS